MTTKSIRSITRSNVTWTTASDASGDLIVTQLATICDKKNLNNRIYPRNVFKAAKDKLMPCIKSGAMLSDLFHPEKAVVWQDGIEDEKYVDNGPENKTGVILNITDPDSNGNVYITRRIFDNDAGKKIAARIKAKKPMGISMRFRMAGNDKRMSDGSYVTVAEDIILLTFDDVLDPAVPGAGKLKGDQLDLTAAIDNCLIELKGKHYLLARDDATGGQTEECHDVGTSEQIHFNNAFPDTTFMLTETPIVNPHPSMNELVGQALISPFIQNMAKTINTDDEHPENIFYGDPTLTRPMATEQGVLEMEPNQSVEPLTEKYNEKGGVQVSGPKTHLQYDPPDPNGSNNVPGLVELDDTQYAGPHESFPLERATGKNSVKSAAGLVGHAADPAKVKANIKRIAKENGWESGFPETWKEEDSTIHSPEEVHVPIGTIVNPLRQPPAEILATGKNKKGVPHRNDSSGKVGYIKINRMNISAALTAIQDAISAEVTPKELGEKFQVAYDAIAQYKGAPSYGPFVRKYQALRDEAVIAGYHGKPIAEFTGGDPDDEPTDEGYASDLNSNEKDVDKEHYNKRKTRELKAAQSRAKGVQPKFDAQESDGDEEGGDMDDDRGKDRVSEREGARGASNSKKSDYKRDPDEEEDDLEDGDAKQSDTVRTRDEVVKAIEKDSRFSELSKDNITAIANELIVETGGRKPSVSQFTSFLSAKSKAMLDDITTSKKLESLGIIHGEPQIRIEPRASATVKFESLPNAGALNATLDAIDDLYRNKPEYQINPDEYDMQLLKKENRRILTPLLEKMYADTASIGKNGMVNALDHNTGDGFLRQVAAGISDYKLKLNADGRYKGAADAVTTTASLFNNPTTAMALLVQKFQYCVNLQFASVMGPGMANPGETGWYNLDNGIGSVLKIASEVYNDPTNGAFYGGYDAGLLNPENTGIATGSVSVNQQVYAPILRRLASMTTHDAQYAMGNGPLGYPVVARNIFHMTARLGRTIDKGVADNMFLTPLQSGAVVVASEVATTVNSYLPNNSAYQASAPVVVNLNPAKLASATVASSDPSVTYGTGTGQYLPGQTAGAGVVAAYRVKAAGTGTASPYFGDGTWNALIVQPSTSYSLPNNGTVASTTVNPIGVTVPASQVLGYLDQNNNVQSTPGTTATFAVDYKNGVIVFTSAAGLAGSAGVVTTSITVNYSYATNYTTFVTTQAIASLGGQTFQDYLNGYLLVLDLVGAILSSYPNNRQPNLSVMSMKAATFLIQASQFRLLQNVAGTKLYPTANYFAERNGIDIARINTPLAYGDALAYVGVRGTTRYAIDVPYNVKGPVQAYEQTSALPIAGEYFYGEESSLICTPQVTDQSGNVVNKVSSIVRMI